MRFKPSRDVPKRGGRYHERCTQKTSSARSPLTVRNASRSSLPTIERTNTFAAAPEPITRNYVDVMAHY